MNLWRYAQRTYILFHQVSQMEAAAAKLRQKAKDSCEGDAGCEKVLSQVMELFKK